MKAYVFPGQGAQFSGMGKDIFDKNPEIKKMFLEANNVLGFEITKIMFEGSDEDLKQTKVTQPAVFIHSVAKAMSNSYFKPEMLAGHSLGEFSALVAGGVLDFKNGLELVSKRAMAMQEACEIQESGMAAVLNFDVGKLQGILDDIDYTIVVANFNSPAQLVISGDLKGIDIAMEKLKEAGARRVIKLPVGGAFHSPFMNPAKEKLQKAIEETEFKDSICPIYQNVDAMPYTDAKLIKENLIKQLTSPVLWTQIVQNMIADGATQFVESGPGNVLQTLIKKIDRSTEVSAI